MKIKDIVNFLESFAPLALQEEYDNAGLIIGDDKSECTGILCTLDTLEATVEEAIREKCNLIVSHHPLIFHKIKRITGAGHVDRTLIRAIKNDIAVYAAHTNLDNLLVGVNGKIASLLDLGHLEVLAPKEAQLRKLFCFVPVDHLETVRNAIFSAGGGHIGQYSECSFNSEGKGTFKGAAGTNPFVGQPGERHEETEIRTEVIFPAWLQQDLVIAMENAHPYEEPAYDIIELANPHPAIGAGLIGSLESPLSEKEFLERIRARFKLTVIRHTPLRGLPVKKIALCGGSGSSLIPKALAQGADFFVSADFKYHDFFEADGRIVLADIGHFESEQFTTDLLHEILRQKFHNFAVLKTKVQTNPVQYFV